MKTSRLSKAIFIKLYITNQFFFIFSGQPIKDAVITVPPFFNQAERRAMLEAAKLSGLNVLQLINSNTAGV